MDIDEELVKQWREKTAPALVKYWPRRFRGNPGGTVIIDIERQQELYYTPLDPLHRISELLGVVTDARFDIDVDGLVVWYGTYTIHAYHTNDFVIVEGPFQTELEARLAVVIEVVDELVKEKNHVPT